MGKAVLLNLNKLTRRGGIDHLLPQRDELGHFVIAAARTVVAPDGVDPISWVRRIVQDLE